MNGPRTCGITLYLYLADFTAASSGSLSKWYLEKSTILTTLTSLVSIMSTVIYRMPALKGTGMLKRLLNAVGNGERKSMTMNSGYGAVAPQAGKCR